MITDLQDVFDDKTLLSRNSSEWCDYRQIFFVQRAPVEVYS